MREGGRLRWTSAGFRHLGGVRVTARDGPKSHRYLQATDIAEALVEARSDVCAGEDREGDEEKARVYKEKTT
jgi:hypothetical protein